MTDGMAEFVSADEALQMGGDIIIQNNALNPFIFCVIAENGL
jgi:hypothetical protein